jgi:16S rRNA (guanine527-N7)-methyltransferase
VVPPPSQGVLNALTGYGLPAGAPVLDRLGAYLRVLLETNQAFNLTAVTDPDTAWSRHIEDSLSVLPWIAIAPDGPVADVGSGGGLPAIPLAIALPDRRFTLVEATGKKAAFLRDVAAELGLRNVQVEHARIEDFGQAPAARERFSVATSRALSRLPVLLELTLPLLAVRGHALAIKGEQAPDEVAESARALELLGGEHMDCIRTPTGTIVRTRKVRPTPKRYPRRPGEPKRAPLT